MGIFTISQTPNAENIYLYPNGDVCTQYDRHGDTANWKCVDENRNSCDEDATYVFSSKPTDNFDIYSLQDKRRAGYINYVQVIGVAKSDTYAQDKDGHYKLLVDPASTCTDIYESEDFDITTTYSEYTATWTENPMTSADWTWGDIEDLGIGVKCSSPSYPTTKTLTLNPDGQGTWCGLEANYCPLCGAAHQNCVTTESPPQAYLSARNLEYDCPTESEATDTFTMEDHTTEAGTIVNVKIYERLGKAGIHEITADIVLITHGTMYSWETANLSRWATTGWEYFTKDLPTNPNTGAAWTWDEIDAMEVGCRLGCKCIGDEVSDVAYCDRIYVVVEYLETISPEIRTTQCYARVNYDPKESVCTLNKPSTISTNHSRNIKMLNFWSGNRAVYDVNRSGKSMVMTGLEWYETSTCTDPCGRIECVRAMGENGADVEVSGLGARIWDATYKIRSFGWKKITDCPLSYEWIIELEDTRYCAECGDGTYVNG